MTLKKTFSFLLVLLATGLYFNAYSQCTPPPPTGTPDLTPNWACLPCVVQGESYSEDIFIENFSSVAGITVTKLEFDTIQNVPSGISYQINPANGEFASGQTGCLHVTGTSNDTVGDYQLQIFVRVTIDLGGSTISIPSQAGNYLELGVLLDQIKQLPGIDTNAIPNFDYYMRVVANAGDCNIPDSCSVGINPLNKIFTELSIQPNPFKNQTQISFNSNDAGVYQAKLFDAVGKEVYAAELNVTVGKNVFTLKRDDLPNGVYFYNLSDGKSNLSKRVLIRD